MMADPRGPVDHGVQIRFITEPEGAAEVGTLRRGGRRPAKDARASTYGVAVRVQGIAGQPFVVLNSGEKGSDSFGVQIKGTSNRGSPGALSSDSEPPENPYSQVQGFPAPSQGSTSDEEPRDHWNGKLLRSQSQASLTGLASVGPSNRSASLLELAPQKTPPVNTIDTAPLSSVDSLINKFDSQTGGQVRGRTGRRTRTLPHEQRKRSQSLDSRLSRENREDRERPPHNHWSPGTKYDDHVDSSKQPSQSQSSLSSFSRSRQTQDWVLQSFEEPREKAHDPTMAAQFKSTPDLLRDQREAAPPGSVDHMKATIYGILREGSPESEASVKRKVSLVLEQMQPLGMVSPASTKALAGQGELTRKVEELQKKLDEEVKKRQKLEPSRLGLERQLEEKTEECNRLQELLERRKGDAQQSAKELQNMKLLLGQEEGLRHGLETQVKELQIKLKQGQSPEPAKEILLKDLLETRELLEEVLEGKQRVEEQLRLRERELTALKGALKEEVASHDQEVEHVRLQYQRDTEQLRRSMQDVTQDHAAVEAERQKMSSLVRELQRELEETSEETGHWQNMFQKNKEELRATKQELLQLRMEKEEMEEELGEKMEVLQRDLEQARAGARDTHQVEELKKELRRTQAELKELQAERQSREVAGRQRDQELEKQLAVLRAEAERARDLEQQNLQLQKTLQQLRQDCEEASKAKLASEAEAMVLGQRRATVETTLRETQEENDDFRRRILGLEQQLKEARGLAEGGEAVEARLRDKVHRLEVEKQQLAEALNAAQEEEGSLAAAKRALEVRLDEAQRGLARLGQEQQALNRALEEEGRQREALRRSKAELEEQKRLLNKTVDRLNKELEQIGDDSKLALQQLQSQMEDYKEKARREVADAQRQAKDWASEAEKNSGGLSRLQDELQRLRQALQTSQAERDTARLDKELLAQRLQGLEQEAENKKRTQDDKARLLKSLEEKVSRLEAELDEEKNTVELLTDRVNRGRDQMDQLRTELMQERSARQDLECDKISLERQNKDLKTRLASSEGFQKPSASFSQLESQNQLLQERLQAEEREKTVLQSTNRKLERRVKELSIQIDDERQHVNDQKDQLSLRVKALKRQVDEAEEEIERLDSLRKKAQRELEEQHEVNEQLQARIKSLEKDAWRKASRSAAEAALKQEGLSSDEEFDGVYDPSSIASLLTESNLQTSSC
ncbi:cingulin [Peromyscus maniculatus bairdii]|uniref:Cingulin n=1 Tax=Peromyscus maniculatus bairdii TaxID=230844 RepID=A0A8C8TT31_PERMB|nr:cingulin [Peromyscus maniculatus bairdii]XP_042135419.1 cingulin [Peromyscus maniculatus bairdii]XP_042135420.1 cingulin [Peromyscus maniculatus bairdii]XP_042135421.1 cingulin [Peromyscus maniculatus bairdii]